MRERFFAFVEEPTADAFRAVRADVVAHEKYDGYSRDLDAMDEAVQQKRFADVGRLFGDAQPNLLLSPRAHMLLSLALRELGHTEAADIERFIFFRCIDGILTTGDGSRDRPYLVLRLSDEYDVLMALDKRLQSQGLTHGDDDHSYDVLHCEDGSEVWFDITDPFSAMSRQPPD